MSVTNPLTALPRRSARWSALHPWRAILAWLAFVVIAVGLAAIIPTVQAEGADYRLGDSGRADAILAEGGLDSPDTELVLITAGDTGALDPKQAETAAGELSAAMASAPGVTEVTSPQWSADHSALLVAVQLARDGDLDVEPLQEVTDTVAQAHPSLTLRQSGDVSLNEAINDRVAEDLGSAEGISLPITLVLMLLAFGALIAAGIPVLFAVTSVAATIGILAPISHLVHAEGTVTSMIVLIGMAVGVDYSLFYLKREREERANGHTTLDAVAIAAETSGHSILVSGAAVIAALSGLFIVGGATFNSLAVGAILVVAIAVLGSITVLPALLVKLGRWVDRPRVPLLWRINARIGRGGLSRRLLAPVLRRPVAALVLSGLVVAALAVPALGLRMHAGNLDTLPASITEVQTMRDITTSFPSEGASATVVVRGAASDQAGVAQAFEDLRDRAVATGDFVVSGDSPATVETSSDGRTSVLRIAMPYDESDARVDEALRSLRTDLVPASFAGVAGVETAVGGGAAENLDFADRQSQRLPLVIGFVLLLTFLMMLATFRSVVVAAVSVVLNLASVAVSFGLMALVFQHGWGADLLDFTSPGFVIDWLPLFVLVVLVGLSMDYHVFVVSRIREHVAAGLSTRQAVERGIADTAGVVTSAAAVMVSVFAIFATLSMLEMKMMGVGLSAAILLDATLVRLVMLPALLVLLGERAWWPSRPAARRDDALDPGDVRAVQPVG